MEKTVFKKIDVQNAISVVKDIMVKEGLDQEGLADKLSTTQSNINKCLKKGFSFALLCRIAERFDLSLDYLVGRRTDCLSETEKRFKKRAGELLSFVALMKGADGMPRRVSLDEKNRPRENFEIAYDELARHLCINEEDLHDYLTNDYITRFLTMEQIEKIADFFHVSLDYLFDRKRRGFSALEKGELAANMLDDGNVSFAKISKDGIEYTAFYFPEREGESGGIMSSRLLDNAAVNRYIKNCLEAKEKLESGDFDIQTYNTVVAAYKSQLRNKLQNPQLMQAEIAVENAIRNAERKKEAAGPENKGA